MITQLGQLGQDDPIEALTQCAAAPAACTNFSTVLVNLIKVPADRRVLELISGAMAAGPQGGQNPFYASPFAVDTMRIHADADPDAASDLLIQATQAVLADQKTAQASQGKDGFFAHVIDGLVARVLIFTAIPAPPDLRVRVLQLLQALSASGLPDTAQRAREGLALLGAGSAPRPTSTPTAPPAPSPVPAQPVVPARSPVPAQPVLTPSAPSQARAASSIQIISPKAIVLLVGTLAVAGAIGVAVWRATRVNHGYLPRQLRDDFDDDDDDVDDDE